MTSKISLRIDNLSKLTAQIGSTTSTSRSTVPNVIPLSTWKMITASFILAKTSASSSLSIYIDSTESALSMSINYSPGSVTFLPDDKVHIGGPNGFIGKIANFRIYSPGSISTAPRNK